MVQESIIARKDSTMIHVSIIFNILKTKIEEKKKREFYLSDLDFERQNKALNYSNIKPSLLRAIKSEDRQCYLVVKKTI